MICSPDEFLSMMFDICKLEDGKACVSLFLDVSRIKLIPTRTDRYLGKRFCKMFLRAPQLDCSFPAAQASKGNYQKIVYKTSYASNGQS